MLKAVAIIAVLSNLQSNQNLLPSSVRFVDINLFFLCVAFDQEFSSAPQQKWPITKSKLHRVAAIFRLENSQTNDFLSEHISQIVCTDVGKIFQYAKITAQIKTDRCTLNFSCNLVLQSSCDICFTNHGISVAEDHKTHF